MLRGVDAFLSVCDRLAILAANSLLIAMVVGNLVTMLVREVAGKGLVHVFPMTMVGFAWLVFIGFYIVYRRRADVVMAVLTSHCRGVVSKVLATVAAAAGLFLLALILSETPRVMELSSGYVEIVELPKRWVIAPLFVACGLLVLDGLLTLVRIWTSGGTDRPQGDRP